MGASLPATLENLGWRRQSSKQPIHEEKNKIINPFFLFHILSWLKHSTFSHCYQQHLFITILNSESKLQVIMHDLPAKPNWDGWRTRGIISDSLHCSQYQEHCIQAAGKVISKLKAAEDNRKVYKQHCNRKKWAYLAVQGWSLGVWEPSSLQAEERAHPQSSWSIVAPGVTGTSSLAKSPEPTEQFGAISCLPDGSFLSVQESGEPGSPCSRVQGIAALSWPRFSFQPFCEGSRR